MTVINQQVSSLDDFQGWSQEGADEDFFKDLDESNSTVPDEEVETSVEEVSEGGEESESTVSVPSTEKREDLFSAEEEVQGNIEEEEEEEEEGKPKVRTHNLTSAQTLEFLKERGLVDYELEEGEELTEELAEDLVEDSFDSAVENRVKGLFEELPDVVKQLNAFVLKGGNLNDFLGNLVQNSAQGISDDMDLEDESDQEVIVREMMKSEGNDTEIINAQIEFLKDSGKLHLFANNHYNKWKTARNQSQKDLVEKQNKLEKDIRDNIRDTKRRMATTLSKSKDLGGISISREDSKAIPEYVNDRTVKLQNGSYISQLQKELYYDLPQNELAYLQLATLMKNRNEDGTFNFESLEESATTKVTKNVKDNLRRTKSDLPSSSTNRSFIQGKKSLADFFNPQ